MDTISNHQHCEFSSLEHPGDAVHDAADDEGGDGGAGEGEGQDGADVAEEEALLHAAWWQFNGIISERKRAQKQAEEPFERDACKSFQFWMVRGAFGPFLTTVVPFLLQYGPKSARKGA